MKIGDTVHYVEDSGKHRAAIVTDLNENGAADLTVFPGSGYMTVYNVKRDEQKKERDTFHEADEHEAPAPPKKK